MIGALRVKTLNLNHLISIVGSNIFLGKIVVRQLACIAQSVASPSVTKWGVGVVESGVDSGHNKLTLFRCVISQGFSYMYFSSKHVRDTNVDAGVTN